MLHDANKSMRKGVKYTALAVSAPAQERRERRWSEDDAFVDASKSTDDSCDDELKADEEAFDQRRKDYPIPLVAQTVDLNNDET